VRLEAAGAVVLGKLNCDELPLGIVDRKLGVPSGAQSRDKSRVAGGSSGGSAAAVCCGNGGGNFRNPIRVDRFGSRRRFAAWWDEADYGRVSRLRIDCLSLSSLDHIGRLQRR